MRRSASLAGERRLAGVWGQWRSESCSPRVAYIWAMSRTDRASRLIDVSVERAFEALIEREALLAWLPPDGMTAAFKRFDLRPGGSYRLVPTFDDANSRGKTSADSDVVEARFVDIVANERVVQAVNFVSEDPRFAGTMTMTCSVRAVDGETMVEIIAEDVPIGISAADHAVGMSSSLDKLARYLGA